MDHHNHDMGHAGHDMGHAGHDMGHAEHDMGHGADDGQDRVSGFDNHIQVRDSMDVGAMSMSHGMSHGDGHKGMSHSMTFHGGVIETILFSWWDTKTTGGMVSSCLAIFVVAMLYEGLKYYRKHLLWRAYTGLQYCAVAPPDKATNNPCSPEDAHVIQAVGKMVQQKTPKMLSVPHAYQTFLHGVQMLISYMLMLVFMTYNSWLCAAVILGSASGYFLFGWRESVVVDFTEHCH